MKKITLSLLLLLVFMSLFPHHLLADERNESDQETKKDTYNEYGIKEGTEVYGEDISKLSEKELQYIPEGWRDGIIESEHPEEKVNNTNALSASYPNVNNYIKSKKLKVVKYEYDHISFLPKFNYRNGRGAVEGVVAHETANPNSNISGEINWMKTNYKNAFVHAFVDHNRIIEVHPLDYGAWGAGRFANERFVHVELVQVHSFDHFARSINNYADYIASILYDYDLGVSSAENTGKGSLWSHKAVSTFLGGTTHVDPHGYFAKYGYNWSEFVKLVTTKYNDKRVPRIAGDNRYDTAVQVSQEGWKSANTVVLARGDEYADALAGVPLAKKNNAPLLLTQPKNLTKVTLNEIKRLKAKTVYLLGGTVAINKKVENELKNAGINVNRIAGDSRDQTAVGIAKEVLKNGKSKEAVLVNGYNFPDALSVASYAAKRGIPILLTQTNKVSQATKRALSELDVSKTFVIGGSLAVSDNVLKQTPKAVRISGKDRYATAVEVAKYFDVNVNQLYITTGIEFPDALSGAALAGKEGTGVLLTSTKVPEQVSTYLSKSNINLLTIVGGPVAVSNSVQSALVKLIEK